MSTGVILLSLLKILNSYFPEGIIVSSKTIGQKIPENLEYGEQCLVKNNFTNIDTF